MKTQRGFTFTEFIIAALIVAIVALTAMKFLLVGQSGSDNITFGINGMTESRCIDGYKFIIGGDGQPRQIMNSVGHGVQCETQNIGSK